jgi:MFS family permease
MILFGAVTLVLACITAPLSPDVVPLAVALFLLGVGWNFCFVGGSTLLSDQLSPAERSRTQGTNDLIVGLASSAISLGSGVMFGAIGYLGITLVAGALALIPLAMASIYLRTPPQISPAVA